MPAQQYRVTGERPVLDHEPGSVFDHEFADPIEEADLVRQGRLLIEPRTYKVTGPRRVFGVEPGGEVELALPQELERFHLESGALERKRRAETPDSKTSDKKEK